MPLAVVLELESAADVVLPATLGREVQAWLLEEISARDRALSASLHASQVARPYTLSTLSDEAGRPLAAGQRLHAGARCWLRLTVLHDELASLLLHGVIPFLARRVELRRLPFRLRGVIFDSALHPWAGQVTYADLVRESERNQHRRQVGFEFVSPTAFGSDGSDIPVPLPGLLFSGCWRRWNEFAQYEIAGGWPAFFEACVVISCLGDINTTRWEFGQRAERAAVGFTGRAQFTLVSQGQCRKLEEKALERRARRGEPGDLGWTALWPHAGQVLQALAAFAFYCGTGHHTTNGMGQTRPLA